MEWLWFLIAAVTVFIVWVDRRAERRDDMHEHWKSQQSGSSSTGKRTGGKRRAR